MKIEPLGSGRLKVWMTERDMSCWGLRFERMDAQDAATRAAITKILNVARQRDYPSSAEDLTVEAVPMDGGCLFLFTPRHPRPLCRMPQPQIYAIDSADELLALGEGLRKIAPLPAASLYAFEETYRLIVYPGLCPLQQVRRILPEFSEWIAEGTAAAAWVKEHGRPLSVGNALNDLCRAIGSPSPERRDPPR